MWIALFTVKNGKQGKAMNVYPCRYRGSAGFGCKDHKQRWMFVPDMGQLSKRIHRNLTLDDLQFANELAYEFELRLENNASSFLNGLKRASRLFTKAGRASTVEGQLLAANY
ncbi:MAG: hypothetical protein RLT87_04575 [Gammaproteobacteria bacterium]